MKERADYARKRLSAFLGLRGHTANHAIKRGLDITAELKLGDPQTAKEALAKWTRDDLETTLLVLAVMVDDSKTLSELLTPVVDLMAKPAQRCGHCNKWFHSRRGTRYCSESCRRATDAEKRRAA